MLQVRKMESCGCPFLGKYENKGIQDGSNVKRHQQNTLTCGTNPKICFCASVFSL